MINRYYTADTVDWDEILAPGEIVFIDGKQYIGDGEKVLLDIFPFNNICDWIEFTGNKSVENNEIIKFFPSYKKAIRADSSTYKYLGYYNSLFYYILETDTISHIFTIIGIKNYGEIYSTPVFTTTVTNPIKSYSVDWQLLPDGYIYGGVMNASYNQDILKINAITGNSEHFYILTSDHYSKSNSPSIANFFYVNNKPYVLIKGSNPLTHYIYPVEDNATSSVLLGTKYLITDMFLLENNKIAIGVTSSATAQLPSSWQLCNFSSEESISCTIVDNLILTRSQCFDLDDEDSLSDLSNYTYLTYCDNDLQYVTLYKSVTQNGVQTAVPYDKKRYSAGYQLDDNYNFTLILPDKSYTFSNKYLTYYIDGEQKNQLHLLKLDGTQDIFTFTK